uniref:Uncharacterized protein AlNc14C132G6980 n=1 Tax=Albugo laibachii Nc14 TaxID=890382 RepID=F0WKC8_9STRA|nr:conserved hypothetical protein [Albugo laibachii Nc14]|eukprot:CCA21732.1 conserved hypothetical protein [Albugo laibachii Nc14]
MVDARQLFRCRRSLQEEMVVLRNLQEKFPMQASRIIENGNKLVQIVQLGNIRALYLAIRYMDESYIMPFFSIRMFRIACNRNRLDILSIMIKNGFDASQIAIRNTVHKMIELVDSDESATSLQSLVRFLVESGMNVNWQRECDLWTPLHVACDRNHLSIAYFLVSIGADVNAVAQYDRMPLQCALSFSQKNQNHSSRVMTENQQLIDMLRQHGARETWRTP